LARADRSAAVVPRSWPDGACNDHLSLGLPPAGAGCRGLCNEPTNM
jgi:hypothetical protein